MTGPNPVTLLNRTGDKGTSNHNNTNRSIIEGHLSTLKELLKEPATCDLIKPILLNFNDDGQYTDKEVKELNKRKDKGKAMANDEDLSKSFKEILKCPFTRRIIEFSSPGHKMPMNVKIHDGTSDQEDHKPFHRDRKSGRVAYARMVSNVLANAGWQGKGMAIGNRFGVRQVESSGKRRKTKGKNGQSGNGLQKGKIINMVRCQAEDQKRKSIMMNKEWMKVPITFPPVLARDLSEEALVVEAEIEGARLTKTQTMVSGFSERKNLSSEGSTQLKTLLKENQDIYAWEPSDMTEKSQAVTKELAEWLKAGIVRKAMYLTYISNLALVKKVDNSWRMCIDFKNINAACPKDYYPLSEINLKIKSVNLKAYVDDMVVKIQTKKEIIADVVETNAITQNIGPDAKLIRKAGSTKLLPLSLSKESLPFFETLKNITKENKDDYWWIEDVETAFQELKKTILNLPSLTTSLPKETEAGLDTAACVKKVEKVLVDFINEVPVGSDALIPRSTPNMIDQQIDHKEEWVLYMDGRLVSKAREYKALLASLRIAKKIREASEIRDAMYKMKMEHYYNKRVRPASFKVGEYVYQKNETSRMEKLEELGPKWKGPYLVTKA
nr:putative polyprotein [Tanacetum cinerariifolium]